MRSEQNGEFGSDRAHAEKATTFAGMVAVVVLAIGMMVGRPILMHMDESGILVVISQAMRRNGTVAEGHNGGRRRYAKYVQGGEQTRYAVTPFSGQPAQHTYTERCATLQITRIRIVPV